MVTPPALQAATEALLQLQTKKITQTSGTQTKSLFNTELARQFAATSAQSQSQTLTSGIGRSVVFIPLAVEASIQASASCATQRRNKKTKPPKTSSSRKPSTSSIK